MQVVEADAVVLRQSIAVSPTPTGRDASVVQVGNVVVGNSVLATLPDQNTNRFWVNSSSIMDDVVVDSDVMRTVALVLQDHNFADSHATGTKIRQIAIANFTVMAATTKPGGIVSRVLNFAINQRQVPSTASPEGSHSRWRCAGEGVVFEYVFFHPAFGIFQAERRQGPDTVALDRAMVAFDFSVALWIVGAGTNVFHSAQSNEVLEVFIGINHHVRQASIASQRMIEVELQDGLLFPFVKPVVSRNPAVVFVDATVVFAPTAISGRSDSDPLLDLSTGDFRFL